VNITSSFISMVNVNSVLAIVVYGHKVQGYVQSYIM